MKTRKLGHYRYLTLSRCQHGNLSTCGLSIFQYFHISTCPHSNISTSELFHFSMRQLFIFSTFHLSFSNCQHFNIPTVQHLKGNVRDSRVPQEGGWCMSEGRNVEGWWGFLSLKMNNRVPKFHFSKCQNFEFNKSYFRSSWNTHF